MKNQISKINSQIKVEDIYSFNFINSEVSVLEEYDFHFENSFDTAENEFQNIIENLSNHFEFPYASISLYDKQYQWFVAKIGFNIDKIDIAQSACYQVVKTNTYFESRNLKQLYADLNLSMPQVCIDEKFEYIFSYPIRSDEGMVIGSLNLIDLKERKLTDIHLQLVLNYALLIEQLLSARKNKIKFEFVKKEFEGFVKISPQHISVIELGTNCKLRLLELERYDSKRKDLNDQTFILDHQFWSPYLEKAKNSSDVVTVEYDLNLNNHTEYYIGWVSWLREASNGNNYYAFNRFNKTELKLAKDTIGNQQIQLIEASRMASLGQMAGGIAHEINNPLAVIKGHVEMIKREMKKNEWVSEKLSNSLAKIDSMSDRISRIINSLRRLSREGAKDPMQWWPLSTMLQEVFDLTEARIKHHGIELKFNADDFLDLKLNTRAVLVSQVLVNIINNAVDAIDEFPEGSEKWIEIKKLELADGFNIQVIDSGLGIPHDVVTQMMSPFFTTKPQGKGTGLGLSLAKKYMHDVEGDLMYYAQGVNTEFRLIFSLQNVEFGNMKNDIKVA